MDEARVAWIRRNRARRGAIAASYGSACLVSLAFLALSVAALDVPFRPGALLIFLPPVVLCAFFGGLGPGFVSIAVVALGADYLGLAPLHSFAIAETSDLARWLGLIVVGTLLNFTIELLNQTRSKAAAGGFRNDAILQSIREAVVAADPKMRVIFMNDAAERMTGWPKAEAIGKPLADVFAISAGKAVHQAAGLAGMPREIAILTSRDGFRKSIEYSRSSIGSAQGPAAESVIVFHDISERERTTEALRESEEKLSLALQAAKMSVYSWEPHADRISFERLRRIDGEPEFVVTSAKEFLQGVHPDDRARVDDVIRNALIAGPPFAFQYRFVDPDGKVRWISNYGQCRFDDNGTPMMIVGTVIDVTEQKRAEEEILNARNQMETSRRLESLGRMTGGIAHDFNNLLLVIGANLELVKSEISNERLSGFLSEAENAVSLGASLNQSLMTFARQRSLSAAPTDINAEARSIVDMIRRVLGLQIQVETSFAAQPCIARVDPTEVQSALLNLALNAFEAMPDGGRLVIETAIVPASAVLPGASDGERNGEYVRISVSDNGAGMTPEVCGRAFEPFFTTRDVGKGTGLGLATIHGFVKQSGGEVTIASMLGEGTTINLYFPRAAPVVQGGNAVNAVEKQLSF